MNEKVERVARAMYETDSGRTDWDEASALKDKLGFDLVDQERWRCAARAAIKELEKPTRNMLMAADAIAHAFAKDIDD